MNSKRGGSSDFQAALELAKQMEGLNYETSSAFQF